MSHAPLRTTGFGRLSALALAMFLPGPLERLQGLPCLAAAAVAVLIGVTHDGTPRLAQRSNRVRSRAWAASAAQRISARLK